MSIGIFLIVLLSAFLHASWNFLCKHGKPSIAFSFLMSLSCILLLGWTPFAVRIEWGNFNYILLVGLLFLSSLGETIYTCGIQLSYSKMDMSQGYPLIRALPVIFIAVIMLLLPPHQVPNYLGAAGLFMVFFGCLLMPVGRFSDLKLKNYLVKPMLFVLMGAIGTTIYIFMDSNGTKLLKVNCDSDFFGSCYYFFLVECCMFLNLGVVLLFQRDSYNDLKAIIKGTPWKPLCAGLFCSLAYILTLYAMLFVDNLSFLQAFRQMSLPIGVGLGMLFLREKLSLPRACGVFFIVSGLVLIAFAK